MHNYIPNPDPKPLDPEYRAWLDCDPEDLWIFDKLILSRKLGYACGPAGVPIPDSKIGEFFCIRPAVNLIGYGLGARRLGLPSGPNEDLFKPGEFWCEWFDGVHRSVDFIVVSESIGYKDVVIGTPSKNSEKSMSQWESWKKDSTDKWSPPKLPDFLVPIIKKYKKANIEYIGDKIIEVHLRHNPDFRWGNREYIPVFEPGTSRAYASSMREQGYGYIQDDGNNGRIGAWIR